MSGSPIAAQAGHRYCDHVRSASLNVGKPHEKAAVAGNNHLQKSGAIMNKIVMFWLLGMPLLMLLVLQYLMY